MASVKLFWVVLAIIFLVEGLGLPFGHQAAYFLILAAPLFLFSLDLYKGRVITTPKKLTLLAAIFILLSLISTVLAANIQTSFEKTLLYTALWLMFVYSINHQEELSRFIIQFIAILAFLFTVCSIILKIPGTDIINFARSTGLQLVFPTFPTHNHLGDFLVLPLLYFFYQILSKGFSRLNVLGILALTPFLLLSFSRSAYLTIFLSLVFIIFYLSKTHQLVIFKWSLLKTSISLLFTGGFLYLAVILSLASVWQAKDVAIFSEVNQFLNQKLGVMDKGFLGDRQFYFSQTLDGVWERPLFGFGPGNFTLVSTKYTNTPYLISASSHNIFLDLLSENGLLAGVIFMILALMIIRNSNKGVLFFLFVALLINFQTDYTHMINAVLLLFFILAALIYKEDGTILLKPVLLLSWILFILAALILISQTALKYDQEKIAFYLYPLRQESIQNQIEEGGQYLLNYYEMAFPNDPLVTGFLGDMYYNLGDQKKALTYYKKVYQESRFINIEMAGRLYQLLGQYEGQDQAFQFGKDIISFYQRANYSELVTYEYKRRMIEVLCSKFDSFPCPKEVHLGS